MKNKFLIFLLAGSTLALVAATQNYSEAHASYDLYGNFYCGDKAQFEEDWYRFEVNNFGGAVDVDRSIEELNKGYVQHGGVVDELDKMAACLNDVHHIDPDSVAVFSDKAQEVLSYDMPRLMEIAPHLANYADVPEFGSTATMIMVSSVIGSIIIYKRFF